MEREIIWIKYSPRILTYMVAPIVKYLHSRGSACRPTWMILQTKQDAGVRQSSISVSFGTPWERLLPYLRTKPPGWKLGSRSSLLSRKLPMRTWNGLGELSSPAVWKAPFHDRALQKSLIISLKGERNKYECPDLSPLWSEKLEWWASGGLRTNRISLWCPPKPTLHIWSDVSMHAGGALTFSTPGQNRRQVLGAVVHDGSDGGLVELVSL